MTTDPNLFDFPSQDDDNFSETDWTSKSEMKRSAEVLKSLGKELIEMSPALLAKIPLDDDMQRAIQLGQRIKKEGRRRQIQLIGKMLRARDPAPIYAALDKINNKHNQQVSYFHRLETLRDRLIEQGDSAIQEVLQRYPNASRQQLRALIRTAQKERAEATVPKAYRQLFQYLKELEESTEKS